MKISSFARGALFLAVVACDNPNKDMPEASGLTKTMRGANSPEEAPDFKNAVDYSFELNPSATVLTTSVKIKPGYHVYTTGETTGRPLEIKISEQSPVKSAGPSKYPAGKKKQTSIGPSVVVVGEASISTPVDGAKAPKKQVQGSFRYQVCTDSACDRPRTKTFEVAASN